MSCKFDVTLKETPIVYINKAKSAIEKLSGQFQGDDKAGTLSVSTVIGDIRARYNIINEQIMHIEVLEKPFFLSCEKIQTVLREYIG